MTIQTTEQDPKRLLEYFLEVCNRSILNNREKFPFCQIWRAAEQNMAAKRIEFILVDDRPKALCHISLIDGTIVSSEPDEERSAPPAIKINMSYVEEVVREPEKYIKDPTLLNWDWMRSR